MKTERDEKKLRSEEGCIWRKSIANILIKASFA